MDQLLLDLEESRRDSSDSLSEATSAQSSPVFNRGISSDSSDSMSDATSAQILRGEGSVCLLPIR